VRKLDLPGTLKHELLKATRLQIPARLADVKALARRGLDIGVRRDPALDERARFISGSFSNAAGKRDYKLYIPAGYCGRPLPLVIMLHGCTQSPDDFAAGTRMNDVAEQVPSFVLYPAQTAAANANKCWNWFNPQDQRRDTGEPSIIAGMTQAIMREYAVDPKRVFVAGLSAGAAAAAVLGATYPDLYAAIGVHSGLPSGAARDMISAFSAMRNGGVTGDRHPRTIVPTIVFHGDRDSTVHPRNGAEIIAHAAQGLVRTNSLAETVPGGRSYTRTSYSDADGIPLLEHWVVHGAGHAWSGGNSAGTFTDPLGPDASREMMRFFLARG